MINLNDIPSKDANIQEKPLSRETMVQGSSDPSVPVRIDSKVIIGPSSVIPVPNTDEVNEEAAMMKDAMDLITQLSKDSLYTLSEGHIELFGEDVYVELPTLTPTVFISKSSKVTLPTEGSLKTPEDGSKFVTMNGIKPGSWQCTLCSLLNDDSLSKCETCLDVRDGENAPVDNNPSSSSSSTN